ncbi:MAG: hypothetical protein DRR08_25815 [Candidatus Parabeggiatoa sp. nov. 2]|nr:MAG: hypothetical protein B6247_25805 [Beggiatoa sp. 4572_84]RKZ54870.1 MAG: hypothetical protein DRR08_25815 [Gammaproteobacteria bacterium]
MSKNKPKKPKKTSFQENFPHRKTTHQIISPSQRKTTHRIISPPSDETEKPVWQFKRLDWDGPWGWRNIDTTKWQEIIDKLGDFESRTWADIKSDGNNHYINLYDKGANIEAKNRLKQLKLDDFKDLIFSLRLSGKERIYGILDGYILKILWWDPYHNTKNGVYPSLPK